MRRVKILSMVRMGEAEKARICAIYPGIDLIDAGGWFDGEIRETWPEYASNRYLPAASNGNGTRAERDALLAEAEIILGGFPPPFDIRSRAPKMKWFHQRPAGASNLFKCDLWGSDVVVSTSRGYGNILPIAEWALSGMMYFAKGFHQAESDRNAGAFDNAAYAPLLIRGKTVCVIGAGGIGLQLQASGQEGRAYRGDPCFHWGSISCCCLVYSPGQEPFPVIPQIRPYFVSNVVTGL